jgi:hypothetical protein
MCHLQFQQQPLAAHSVALIIDGGEGDFFLIYADARFMFAN